LLGHPGAQPQQQSSDALRRLARGVLERGELLRLVGRAQALGGVDQQVGRVLDQPVWPDQLPQAVDQVGRDVEQAAFGERLPADHADVTTPTDPFVREDLAERLRAIARL
jgi:hypothetical protein